MNLQNTRKSYPTKISSTDEFLNCGNLAKAKRAHQRRASSSASIGAADTEEAEGEEEERKGGEESNHNAKPKQLRS